MAKTKKFILILGEVAILYGALAATLIIRYGADYFKESFNNHLKPFTLIFLVWLFIFYLADLYKDKNLRINLETTQLFVLAIAISVVSSIILFYLFPSFFKVTPKTNLVIFALVFGILDFGWRLVLVKIYIFSGWKNHLLFIGDSPIIGEIINYLKSNPQLGYEIKGQINDYSMLKNYQADTIVIQPHLKKEPEFVKTIYQLLPQKIAIVDLITFYETVFQKLPLKELEESWFIERINFRHDIYDSIKRIIDISFSLILGIILIVPIFIIAVLVRLTSRGPIIFKQERVGKNEKKFTLYKFRTMKVDAEKNGAQWATKNDPRVTSIGRFLRRSHLDELPQLLNIFKGDISFVGPRPERPEFVSQLKEKIPYYEIRHLVKPGLTGWAQINYRYGASIEDAYEKLQYDIYYLKNRSLILDILIALKTIRLIFINPQ